MRLREVHRRESSSRETQLSGSIVRKGGTGGPPFVYLAARIRADSNKSVVIRAIGAPRSSASATIISERDYASRLTGPHSDSIFLLIASTSDNGDGVLTFTQSFKRRTLSGFNPSSSLQLTIDLKPNRFVRLVGDQN